MSDSKEIQTTDIESKILVIRNQQVMVDRDIAELYGVETRRLNEQVKRNIERFPEDFCFQLTEREFSNLISQNATSSWGGTRKLPYVFTEQGVAMLSSVLKSETAIKTSIQIMKAFVAMRHFLQNNIQIFSEINSIKQHLLTSDLHQLESDKRIDELFDKMDKYGVEQKQGIFYQGQIFDAYSFFQKLIQKAKSEIILIDGYVDLTVLDRLSKKKKNVDVKIYTQQNPKMKNPSLTTLDIQKFNTQYPTLTVNYTNKVHDRFLIIDQKELYHIGASIKDLGQKCFAFELMEDSLSLIPELIAKL